VKNIHSLTSPTIGKDVKAMSQEHDVVFIGAGHNGLTAAGYLAKAGVDVCLVEKESLVGGAVTTQEVTLPGFKHDLGGMAHAFIQSNPLITGDELELQSRFGLKYIYPEAPYATVFPDETALVIYADLDRTCQSIAQFSEHDADAYRRFYEMSQPLVSLLTTGLFAPPPSYGTLMAQLDQSPIGQELIRSMSMSAYDIVNLWFEHDKTKLHLTKYVTQPLVAPEESGSSIYLFLLVPLMHQYPQGLPEGGSGMLTQALARCVEAHGGTILLDSAVTKVDVQGGRAVGVTLASGESVRARKAVVSNVDPRVLFTEWVAPELTDPDLRRQLANIRDPSFCGIMQHIALNEAPNFKAGPEVATGYCMEPVPWLEDFRRLFDDLRYTASRRGPRRPWSCASRSTTPLVHPRASTPSTCGITSPGISRTVDRSDGTPSRRRSPTMCSRRYVATRPTWARRTSWRGSSIRRSTMRV
jgi:phytoene dehydrogenase-like protein